MVMELRSPEKQALLRMEVISTGQKSYPSVEVQVDLHVQGFAGSEAIWLDHAALMKFSESLDGVERTRRGRADLTPSYPEFRLSISAMDASGHLLVEFVLVRQSFVGDRARRVDLTVTGGFELDPGTLPGVVAEFRNLERTAAGSVRYAPQGGQTREEGEA
jgi:hypothetical protein